VLLQVMAELRLTHIADSRVGGSSSRSISGGELKRVAIAIELVSSPSLLFLVLTALHPIFASLAVT
jgi:ABC-type multidrug transport system ATPase subunit